MDGAKRRQEGTRNTKRLMPFSELPPCVLGAFTHTLLSRMFSAISLSTVRVDFTESLIGPSNPCAPRMSMISGHDQHKYKNAVHACVQSMTQHMHETWIVCSGPCAWEPQPQAPAHGSVHDCHPGMSRSKGAVNQEGHGSPHAHFPCWRRTGRKPPRPARPSLLRQPF